MLLIRCPFCGPRAEAEFACGGEGEIVRPGPPERVSDEDWAQYVHFRRNVKGPSLERWLHRYGCGQWFNVARDTVTHAIRATYRMGDRAPELE